MKVALFILACVCAFATRTAGQAEGVVVGILPQGVYGTSGTVRYISTTQILIENFNYDGRAPAAFWYVYPPGVDENRLGNGGIQLGNRLSRAYSNEDVLIDLPSSSDPMTVCGIGTITVWCRTGRITFTELVIPEQFYGFDDDGNCNVEGLTPVDTPGTVETTTPTTDIDTPTTSTNDTDPPTTSTNDTDTPTTSTVDTDSTPPVATSTDDVVVTSTAPVPEENCIQFHESFQLSWTVFAEAEEIRFTLCGCQSLIPGVNRYLGFGLSGSQDRVSMFQADPTITWVDQNGQPNAIDYYLSAYVQCRGGVGACPDTMSIAGNCTNDVRDVVGWITDGVQCVSYNRSFAASDVCDRTLVVDDTTDTYVVWAFGELGETAFKHGDFSRATGNDVPLRLGRQPPRNECVGPPTCSACFPFNPNQIIAREDTRFTAEIGPSGSDRGYVAATMQAGWGIAWYINGDLAPEIVVERGRTYTFIVNGGDVESFNNIEYHPFYITDSMSGGRMLFSVEDEIRMSEVVYSGFDETDNATAAGSLCQLIETAESREQLEECGSYDDYIKRLQRVCSSPDEPAILVFTPDETTPDIVYYQCAVHLNLGWRFIVLDEGEPAPTVATFVPLGAPNVAFFRVTAVSLFIIVLVALLLQI